MAGLQLAACMPCQIGPNPNPTATIRRSGLAAFNWASAVDTSTAPGGIDTVLTTCALGAAVLSGFRMSLTTSSSVAVPSLRTPIFLSSACLLIHSAAFWPSWRLVAEMLNMYGHLVVSVYWLSA